MVLIQIRDNRVKPRLKRLEALASRILGDLGKADKELSVLITDDEEMRTLNKRFRGIDRTTDVLSFAQESGAAEPAAGDSSLLGDVIISMDRAEAQAREYGVSVDEELGRLLVHGVLHLVGYDHEAGDEEASRMRDIEEKYSTGGR
ncbi:MAG: rRNA maturation RNase YbeY [bacterium]|nr:MAG: rRNA maturation RNase YbeY [bacterium]